MLSGISIEKYAGVAFKGLSLSPYLACLPAFNKGKGIGSQEIVDPDGPHAAEKEQNGS